MRACYRNKELDNLDRLEQRHRAVIYMYVHVRTHKGIIPNEAADVIADKMREGGAKGYLHLTCTSISCHPDTHSAPSRG